MNARLFWSRRRATWSALLFVGLAIAGVLAGQSTLFAVQGLQNPGFEEGLDYWEVTTPYAGNAAVVGTETPSAYPTYQQMGNTTVAPVTGSKMLRIGIPQGRDKHQIRGVTTVRQEFYSETDRLALSFRLFSWEHRDGRDAFVVDVKRKRDGQSVGRLEVPVSVQLPTGTTIQDGPLPYSLSLQIDSTGYLDSQWQTVRVVGLPVGEMLTLSYTLNTDRDAAHDSWVYVDWWNRPPTAMFEFSPDDPHEGDPVGMYGEYSTDPDEPLGDEIVSWDWTLTRPSDSSIETRTGEELFWIPPNQEDYTVKLTVRDSFGAIGETETVVPAQSFAPIVNAINSEVFPAQEAPLFGRTLDQGWLDEHQLSWNIAGATNGGAENDHQAALSSGIVTGTVTASGEPGTRIEGELSVSDADDPSSVATDVVAVRIEDPDPSRYEQGDPSNLDSLPKLSSDWSYLSYLQSAGDVDLYEVKLPDGADLPAGTEVLASLSSLPADYDLVLLSTVPAEESPDTLQFAGLSVSPWAKSPWAKSPWAKSPWAKSPWAKSPWAKSPWAKSDWVHSPWAKSPWAKSPWAKSPWAKSPWAKSPWAKSPWAKSEVVRDPFDHTGWTHAPWAKSPWAKSPWAKSPFDGYPLADLSYTDLDGSNISGTDLAPGELGLDLSEMHLKIAGSSANRGLKNEAVLNATELSTTRMFVAVIGHNKVFDDTRPYRLQIETSRPLELVDLAAEGETYEPLVDDPTSGPVEVAATPQPKTLFVTQRERLEALYGVEPTTDLISDLVMLSNHDKILGTILSVAGDAYTDWDTDPVSVDKANAVASSVRDSVRDYLSNHPSIEYVVLVGNDDVVPYRRVVDETVISNEGQYAGDAALDVDTPLFASIYGQFNLTDDYYVDDLPTPWQGRALYVPDRSISRLVETPAEMRNVISAFMASNGVLSANTALVTGYDFMADGAAAVHDTFAAAGLTTTLRSEDDWTGDQLRADFLSAPKDASDLNAHFTHYAGLSAMGFLQSSANLEVSTDELLTNFDIVDPQFASALRNGLVFSMGCHSGLSVPDDDIAGSDPANGWDPGLDFPQAMARQGGVYIANTGYGLGDTEGLAGSEKLVSVFAEDVTRGDYSVGRALTEAKKRYLLGLSALTTYDEKSSIEFTLYGLPQYELPVSGGSGGSGAPASGSLATASMSTPSGAPDSVHVKVVDGSNVLVDKDYPLMEVAGRNGTYFKAQGQAQATADRPIQPSIVVPIPPDATRGDVHGLIYRNANSVEIKDFDPSISRHTTEWEVNPKENQIAVDGWWPAEPATINTLETPGMLKRERQQELVIVPAQFKPDSAPGDSVMGTERVYSDVVIELVRSTNEADFTAPVVTSTDFSVARRALWLAVEAYDPSGIGVITLTDAGGNLLASADFSDAPAPDSGVYRLNYAPPAGVDPAGLDVIVQVADVFGNVTTVTGKGTATQVVSVEVSATPPSYISGDSVMISGRIADFDALTAPVAFLLDFGDGEQLNGQLTSDNVTVDGAGTATFQVEHTYVGTGNRTVVFGVEDARGARGSGRTVLTESIPDTVPPWTQALNAPDGWTNLPTSITLLATDNIGGSGVASTWFSRTGIDYQLYLGQPLGFVHSGVDSLYFYSEDNAGNREETRTATVYTDFTRPVSSSDVTATYDSTNCIISITATDTYSGVREVRYWLDGNGPYTELGENATTGTDIHGPHTLQFQAEDNAGNVESTQTVTFTVVPPSSGLDIVWVSTSGDDANSGDFGSPVRTIQHATTLVRDGGYVYVAGGDYNENLTITRPMTIQRQFFDPTPVTLTGTGEGPVVTVSNVPSQPVTLRWLEISGGGAITPPSAGGGVRALNSYVVVDACTVLGNTAQSGGGIYSQDGLLLAYSSVIARNDTVLNGGPGGGIYAIGTGSTELRDCTVAENTAGSSAGGLVVEGHTAHALNCAFWDNAVTGAGGDPPTSFIFVSDIGGTCDLAYSFTSVAPEPGVGNIGGVLPGFSNPSVGDYTLAAASPLIDAGATSYSWMVAMPNDRNFNPRPVGFGHDIGAYEYQVPISLQSAPTATEGSAFGSRVAIDGDVAVIGAPREDGDFGAAYVYRRVGGGWNMVQRIQSFTATPGPWRFGSAVAIDGDTIVVGAPSEDSSAGAVYTFRDTGPDWASENRITPSDRQDGGNFGSDLDLEGDRLVVGAPLSDGAFPGDPVDAGAAYVFQRDGGTWSQTTAMSGSESGDEFGYSVAVVGEAIMIGAPQFDWGAPNDGAVFVYQLEPATGFWIQEHSVSSPDAVENGQFGYDVDREGARSVIGERRSSSTGPSVPGRAYVYETADFSDAPAVLAASDTDGPEPDGFGASVALDGRHIVVGASGGFGTPSGGAAYLFDFGGNVWERRQRFEATIPVASDTFGISVGISGTQILVGRPRPLTTPGAAYFFGYAW